MESDEEFLQALETLSDWCKARAGGDHSDSTTYAKLRRKLRKALDKLPEEARQMLRVTEAVDRAGGIKDGTITYTFQVGSK